MAASTPACERYTNQLSTAVAEHLRDDQFRVMESVFNASGRGRRPTLPTPVIDNRLLIQFDILRTEGGHTWDELEEFMLKLLPPYYPQHKFRGLVIKTVSCFVVIHTYIQLA